MIRYAMAICAAWATLLCALADPAQAEVLPEEVRRAIEGGIKYLKRSQNADGSWDDYHAHTGGVTGLCTLALLNAGLTPEDETVRKALERLRKYDNLGTYALSLQTMVFAAAEPQKDLFRIRDNVRALEDMQIKKGPSAGSWSYKKNEGGTGDNSNAQFAVLALHEAERAAQMYGESSFVRTDTWNLALKYWRDQQNPDGSWSYVPSAPGTGSMTCAGIASAIIAADQLNKGDADVRGDEVICCGEQEVDRSIERGIQWLARNFTLAHNPVNEGQPFSETMRDRYHLYYMYGVERVGRMTARRFLGQHDWYREGAEVLVKKRPPDSLEGFWEGKNYGEDNRDVATSLALLFLSKGRRPVVMAKVKHGPGEDWNHHRSDAANLTRYAEQKWKRDLTWQVVDPQAVTAVEDLLQSPVLYLSGRDGLELAGRQKELLRAYIDRGGFIFAEACCSGGGFDQAFRQLMKDIFPEEEYGLRLLPPSHPVWHAEESVDPDHLRALYGVDVGCRTSVVYCPENLSCYWELDRPGRGRKFPTEIQESIDAAKAIGVNVLAYATNRELKFKDEIPSQAEGESAASEVTRGQIRVAKLQHPGGCDAAPLAVSNLMRVAAANLAVPVDTKVSLIRPSDQALFNYHTVFMHGRNAFRLTEGERKQLRTFLERGGTLVADAICANDAFAESFRREIAALLPEHSLEPIPAAHPMFTPAYGGADITQVRRREPRGGGGDPLRSSVRAVQPELQGVRLGDRYAVIFSPYDISCALENHQSLECEGYVREDASRIGLNLLLYSIHH